MLVNLGIGIPTRVANFLPAGLHVFFQSENGLIGTGSVPDEGMAHPTLTDAAGHPVTALPGASTFDSAMSFGLIRGGHLDLTVLGGLQVDQAGLLANWTIPNKMVPGMGGAMQLSNVCWTPGPNMLVIALSDSRQVVAISTVGTPADAAPPAFGDATIRLNTLAAIAFPFVTRDTAKSLCVWSTFGLIVQSPSGRDASSLVFEPS